MLVTLKLTNNNIAATLRNIFISTKFSTVLHYKYIVSSLLPVIHCFSWWRFPCLALVGIRQRSALTFHLCLLLFADGTGHSIQPASKAEACIVHATGCFCFSSIGGWCLDISNIMMRARNRVGYIQSSIQYRMYSYNIQ